MVKLSPYPYELDILSIYLNGWKKGFQCKVYIAQVEKVIDMLKTEKGIKELEKSYKKELKELRKQTECDA